MKILEVKQIVAKNHEHITYIRIDSENIQETLAHILDELLNLSWISTFDEDYIRDSYRQRANDTLLDISQKIASSSTDKVSSDAGEYVVSELAREAIISELNYLNIPLAELYNKKKSGNPGFDFHTQNLTDTIIFGEAKYLAEKNAYGTGLRQVVKFIAEKKDIKDIADICDFCSKKALTRANQGQKGFAVAFSSKQTSSDLLITSIGKNDDFLALLTYEEIILVAVNI